MARAPHQQCSTSAVRDIAISDANCLATSASHTESFGCTFEGTDVCY